MWLNNCIFSAGYIWNQLENGKLFYHNYTKRMVFNIFKVGVLFFQKRLSLLARIYSVVYNS